MPESTVVRRQLTLIAAARKRERRLERTVDVLAGVAGAIVYLAGMTVLIVIFCGVFY